MRGGEWVSIVINLAVGAYLAWLYPRMLRQKLGTGRLPPLFKWLQRIVPLLGYLILASTLLYIVLQLTGYLR